MNYIITATQIINYSVNVKAASKAEAIEIANLLPIDDFSLLGGEFTIDFVEEMEG